MMKTTRLFVAILLIGTVAVLLKAIVRPPRPPLRVAYQVCNSRDQNRSRFDPLTAYLEKKLGRRIVAAHVDTFDFVEMAERREFDVLQTNGYIYINVKEKTGAVLIAREAKKEIGEDTGGLIVVRADSPIRTLRDLRGKTMAFGPVLSPGGYLTQYELMLNAGLDPEQTFSKYTFLPGAWQHEKVVYSVLYGDKDAGAVRFGDLEIMEAEGKIRKSDFRVLAASDPVPNCTFFALPHVDNETVDKVRKALLDLGLGDFATVDGERLSVLKRDGVDGYVLTTDKEFDVLRRMAKATNMPPYERY
jgi:phosphonate transport system substrate-binding protein